MRVVFSGSSGTGKTTLARFLSHEMQLPMNPEGSRSCAEEMGFSNPYEVDVASDRAYTTALGIGECAQSSARHAKDAWAAGDQSLSVRRRFQATMLQAKMAWERSHPDGYVSDRSAMDLVAYALLHDVGGAAREGIDAAARHCRGYDLIIRTPLEALYRHSGDPARVDDYAYHMVYEAMLDGCLLNWVEMPDPRRNLVQFVSGSDSYMRQMQVLSHVRNTPKRN